MDSGRPDTPIDPPSRAGTPASVPDAASSLDLSALVTEPEDAAAPQDSQDGGYGPNSVLPPEDGSVPDGFPVKGNADSMKFHEPDGQWYDQTVAEVYFKTAADAEKAGFTKAGGE